MRLAGAMLLGFLTACVGAPDATATSNACESWCSGYPIEPGCDEGDDGIERFGDESGGGDDMGLGMGDDLIPTSVFAVQQGQHSVGNTILIEAVVVTSPVVRTPNGDANMFTVSDPEGGEFSGLTVRTDADIGELSIGDEVELLGDVHGRYIFSLLDITTGSVEVTGTAEPPPPVVLTLDEADTLEGASLKALESVVVEVLQPPVASAMCDEMDEQAAGLRVDDRFLQVAGETQPVAGAEGYTSVTGPLLYTFNGIELAPRSLADFRP